MEESNVESISFKKQGEKSDFLDGFQQVFGLGSDDQGSSVSSPSTTITETGVQSPPKLDVEEESDKTTNIDETESESQKEQSGEEEESKKTSSKKSEEGSEEEEVGQFGEDEAEEGTDVESEEDSSSSGDNEADETDESEIIEPFFDLFAQELGWDYDESDKPQSISGLVDFMSDIMKQGSQPSFANEDIQKMNDYVANGGKIEDYIDAYSKDIDPNTIEIEDNTDNQKRVIREQLGRFGFSEDNIESKIQRYEDTGTLAEEAEESLSLLKNYNQRETDKLLREQEDLRKEQEKQQQKVVNDVKETIDSMKSVKGIPLTKKQKEDLKSYLLEVDKNGMTPYQRDNTKSYNTLIESAFFTMQGDDIVKQLKRQANTGAARDLKKRLGKDKPKRSKGQSSSSSQTNSGASTLDTVSRISKILSS